MSNCSSRIRLSPTREEETAWDAQSFNLLNAIVDELHVLACEFVEFGEDLSGTGPSESQSWYGRLQRFDILGQRCFALVKLLEVYRRRCVGGDISIAEAVDDVPFSSMRERLLASVEGFPEKADVQSAASESDIDWF